MSIRSSANKYRESGKDSWKSSQNSSVGNKNGSIIKRSVEKGSFSSDSVTKSAYTGYFGGMDSIKDTSKHAESKKGKIA